ncbi:MAG: hypothetical protein ACL93V_16550 [Candidatus Electrothrix sp. YB6]
MKKDARQMEQKNRDSRVSPPGSGIWKIVDDSGEFPELREFIENVAGTEPRHPSREVINENLLAKFSFPPLHAPNLRRLKGQKRQSEDEDIFPQSAAAELPTQKQPAGKYLRIFLFVFLLIFLLGLLAWNIAFLGWQPPSGKVVESGTENSSEVVMSQKNDILSPGTVAVRLIRLPNPAWSCRRSVFPDLTHS